MMNRSDNKELISVRFCLVAEERKTVIVTVNRFLPLINYKRNIENASKIDLYGRQLVFQAKSQAGKANIQYAQEAIELNNGQDNADIFIDILFQEFGG